MSYPIHKVSGGSAARTIRTEKGFWGLDLSSDVLDRSFDRAADTENLIWQGNALRVRDGYRLHASLEGKINGIYSYDEEQIVHAGTKLFRLKENEEPVLIYEAMQDKPSHGTVRFQTVDRRRCLTPYSCQWSHKTISQVFLFINDGANYLFYDGSKVRTVADPYWGENLTELYKNSIFPDFYATVPYTVVAKLPDSGGDADPRGDNRLSQFRCESFYVDSMGDEFFRISCLKQDFNDDIPMELQIRDSEGIWRCVASVDIIARAARDTELVKVETPYLKAGVNFRLSTDGMVVEFEKGDYYFVDDGMDNVRIIYAIKKKSPVALNEATVQGLYGADGADDVLFLGGSKSAPGEDAFSAKDDFFCFYETSVERLGGSESPVTGYCRLSDGRLAVLKDDPDGAAVFFRSHSTVSFGSTQSGEPYRVDAYPSKTGAAVEGCLSPHSVGFAGNEPCFLGRSGIYSVRSVSNELTNLNETVGRSMSIDPLLTTLDAKSARAIRWKNYYLITFGNIAFITDGKKDSSGSFRFLKWKFAHYITALGIRNGALYLGDENGNLYLFGGKDDAGVGINAFWKTPALENTTGHRVILRRMWAAVSPCYNAQLNVGFFCNHYPMPRRSIALHLTDFAHWDFGNVSLDGCKTARWSPLAERTLFGNSVSTILDLSAGADLLLWGLRVTYEKGGSM